jgi:nucleotide-binding universal stress UspA family protein
VKLFDPTSRPVERAVELAPRPASLRGLRLGLVDNTKFNSDTLLAKLAERLARRHGTTVALTSRKRSPSHEIDEAAVKTLRAQADLVVSGIGD